jgi:hypothetical protein
MPEQYTLTMEIAKDRTTKASVDVCSPSSKSGRGLGCPEEVAPGDQFLHRSLNEPCQKMVFKQYLYENLFRSQPLDIIFNFQLTYGLIIGPLES